MRRRGRPILGAITGLLFGVFASITLAMEGLLPLKNNMLAVYPVAGLLLGLILGLWGPFRRGKGAPPVEPLPVAPVAPTPPAATPPPTPPPMTPPEPEIPPEPAPPPK
jgi:hypothetical protein